ncbi:MAG: hypothetical protein AAF642_00750 [Pseudomonadota bacterium]
MSTTGAAALSRLAQNPECQILGAMVMRGRSEKAFFEAVTGQAYDREFGERQSSRRRGAQFEKAAYDGDALLLREALSDFVGLDAKDIRVENLLDHFPGEKDDARIARLRATRKILKAGPTQNGPHLVIQPQLLVPTKPGQRPYFFIAPDILVYDPSIDAYLAGDLKSFVVRENEVAASDLQRVRLQLAAQNLGLIHEYSAVKRQIELPAKGILIFSKPNGLRPHTPRIEDLGGALEAVRLGIAAYIEHRGRIETLGGKAEPHAVVDELEPHFQESCLSTCVMAQYCRAKHTDHAIDLGDAAAETLGDIPLSRLSDLMKGVAQPLNDNERAVMEQLAQLHNSQGGWKAA